MCVFYGSGVDQARRSWLGSPPKRVSDTGKVILQKEHQQVDVLIPVRYSLFCSFPNTISFPPFLKKAETTVSELMVGRDEKKDRPPEKVPMSLFCPVGFQPETAYTGRGRHIHSKGSLEF